MSADFVPNQRNTASPFPLQSASTPTLKGNAFPFTWTATLHESPIRKILRHARCCTARPKHCEMLGGDRLQTLLHRRKLSSINLCIKKPNPINQPTKKIKSSLKCIKTQAKAARHPSDRVLLSHRTAAGLGAEGSFLLCSSSPGQCDSPSPSSSAQQLPG